MSVTNLVALVAIAFTSITLYYKLVASLLPDGMEPYRFPPQDLEDIRRLVKILNSLQTSASTASSSISGPVIVALVYSLGYLIKQAFAIPGSALMNILGGAAFGHMYGWLLISFLTAAGSTLCYWLSRAFLGPEMTWLQQKWPVISRIKRRLRDGDEMDTWIYLISLRLFPFTPNWLLNVTLPHMDIGTLQFFISVLLGLAPYNFITTGAGDMISEIEHVSDVVSGWRLVRLLLMAATLIAISVLKRKFASARGVVSPTSPNVKAA